MTDRNVDSRAASLWEKWMQLNLEKRRRSSSGQGADVRKKASKEDSKEKNDQVPVNTFFFIFLITLPASRQFQNSFQSRVPFFDVKEYESAPGLGQLFCRR